MDELRISLIVIGVVIVGAIYAIGKLIDRSRKPVVVAQNRQEPDVAPSSDPEPDRQQIEPTFSAAGDDRDDEVMDFGPATVAKAAHAPAQTKESIVTKRASEPRIAKTSSAPRDADLVVSLTILARENKTFNGADILTLLESIGIELAEFDIFHYRDDNADGVRQTVFSIANILKPGTFDRAGMGTFATPGLAAFMQIPGPLTASEAFDAMLDKVNTIASRLHGTVCDDKRVPLSPQRAREMRERMLNYDFAHTVHHDAPQSGRVAPRA